MNIRTTFAALTLLAGASFSGVALAAPVNPAVSAWCASGKSVNFAGLNWESGAFLTELMRTMLERGYGCKTDALPGNSVTMEAALSKNDIQVFAEEWVGRSSAWNDAFKAGKVVGVGTIVKGAVEGWYVPEYVIRGDPRRNIKALAPGLKTVADLPKYKDVFKDDEEPSKGRFLNCPSGWTCQGVNSQKLKAYGMSDTYVNFRPGTGPALDSTIASAVQRGKPVLFYYWSPTVLMGRYKFVRLEEPAYSDKCWATLTNQNDSKPCGSASPPNILQVGLSRVFSDADPALAQMFAKMNVPFDVLNQLLAERDQQKLDANTQVQRFLKLHQALWQSWVPPEVAAKINASLK